MLGFSLVGHFRAGFIQMFHATQQVRYRGADNRH